MLKQPTVKLKRVALVTETYKPEINGVTNTLEYLVNGLLERVEQFQLIRPAQGQDDLSYAQGKLHVVLVKGFPIPGYKELQFGLPAVIKLFRLWRHYPPSAVYVATEGPLGWAASFVAKRLNIPVLSGFHTNFQAYTNFYGVGVLEKAIMGYMRHFHNGTQGTLVPTKEQKEMLDRSGFCRVSVMPRGVDCDKFSPAHRSAELREQWGLKENDVAVIYVGRVAAEKNIQLVVKAFEAIKEKHDHAKLIVVGDGPLRVELEKAYPHYVFVGMKTGIDLSQHYASADLFLFGSVTETFGNVVTEAMASGLAVVSYDYAAAKAHLKHEESALLAPLNDESRFVENAVRLSQNTELLAGVRRNARIKAVSISWHGIVDLFEQKMMDISHDGQGEEYGKESLVVS